MMETEEKSECRGGYEVNQTNEWTQIIGKQGTTSKQSRHQYCPRHLRVSKTRVQLNKHELVNGLLWTIRIYSFVTITGILLEFKAHGHSFSAGFWPGILTFAAAVISTCATGVEFIRKDDVTDSDVMKSSAIIITLYAAGAKLLGWY